ncbi:MAG: hypothetical protein M1416_02820 [Candidatus Pacearchaeota archaeon]|nr:hypothetical protein [Candidatus Pacearchaeota archaeon]
MVELKKINEKLFYLFAGGLIIEALEQEILEKAFAFSAIFGSILLISFLIDKLADCWGWVETIKDWIENIIEIIGDFFVGIWDKIKEAFGYD